MTRNYTEIKEKLKFLDHYCYLKIGGRVDRMIFHKLMLKGINERTWAVRADPKELSCTTQGITKNHVKSALGRFVKLGFLKVVSKSKSGSIYLIPDLAEFVIPGWDPRTLDHNPVNDRSEAVSYGDF